MRQPREGARLFRPTVLIGGRPCPHIRRSRRSGWHAVAFDEIAAIMDRTAEAARQLASRARRRVQAGESNADANISEHRKVVEAFLAALASGDFEGLVAVVRIEGGLRIREHRERSAARGTGRTVRLRSRKRHGSPKLPWWTVRWESYSHQMASCPEY